MGDKKSLSRHRNFMSRQTQHEAEVNFVVIEVGKITKRILRHRNSCCDIETPVTTE